MPVTVKIILSYLIFPYMFNRYFVIAAVPSWPDFLTWISRLVEFVLYVHKLLEKVIYYLFSCLIKKILVYFKTLILCMKHNNIITRIIFELVLQKNTQIVEFRIPGYPGPSKERCTEVRLMRGKIFRGKI